MMPIRPRSAGRTDPGATEFGKRVRTLGLELRGLEQRAAGDDAGAVTDIERAAATEDSMAFAFGPPFVDQPAHELLGEALLARHQPSRAAAKFRRALEHAPRRTRSLLGLARASAAAGDAGTAARTYRELAAIWHAADPGLPGVEEARSGGAEP